MRNAAGDLRKTYARHKAGFACTCSVMESESTISILEPMVLKMIVAVTEMPLALRMLSPEAREFEMAQFETELAFKVLGARKFRA